MQRDTSIIEMPLGLRNPLDNGPNVFAHLLSIPLSKAPLAFQLDPSRGIFKRAPREAACQTVTLRLRNEA